MRAALAAMAAATLLVGCGSGSNSALRPGDHVGSAKLVVGTEATGVTLFGRCNPVITKPGVYRRSCRLRRSDALFIGYGVSKPRFATLDAEWKQTSWTAWLDGHRIALSKFGTADTRAFMPGRDKPVIRREWRAVLLHVEGRHRLRYRFRGPLAGSAAGVVDATFTFTLT
jgi:hypothetical protein